MSEDEVELSMGMSGDFEQAVRLTFTWCLFLYLCTSDGDSSLVAPNITNEHMKIANNNVAALLQIKMGSTNVRVGSTIFGARNYDK